jgi:hypothetical protein
MNLSELVHERWARQSLAMALLLLTWEVLGRAEMDEILSRHTGHPVAKIRQDTDRNKTFSAREAVVAPGELARPEAAGDAGEAAVKRIRRESDPLIERIVAGWPHRFEARRALQLGFRAEDSFDEIIRVFIVDDLGKIAA